MQRATLIQLRRASNGQMIEVGQDVLDVCARIREIDRSLGVDYSETGGYFRIYQQLPEGKKHTVTTTLELTPEVIEEVRRLAHPSYNLARELDRLDAQAEHENTHNYREKIGEHGERLAHAIRKDTEEKSTIFVPEAAGGTANVQ